jgi:two-component system, chemotaxis family, sensor kinase CheA
MLDDEELLAGFLEEAREHLATIEPDLLQLESNPGDNETINRLFRSVHSIKGGAGFFGLEKMNTLAHAMETLMSKARTGRLTIGEVQTNALLKGLDRLNLMVADIAGSARLDIDKELALIETVSSEEPGESVEGSTTSPVVEVSMAEASAAAIAVMEPIADREGGNTTTPTLGLTAEQIDALLAEGMNIYTVSMNLNHDIVARQSTPYAFISRLEEMGRFIDSYLDTDDPTDGGPPAEDDLRFVFVFATIMDPSDVIEVLDIKTVQLHQFDPKTKRMAASGSTITDTEPAGTSKTVLAEPSTVGSTAVETPAGSLEIIPLTGREQPTNVGKEDDRKKDDPKAVKAEESVRVSVGKLNKLVDLAGELVLVRNRLLQVGEKEGRAIPGFLGILQNLNMVTSGLQEEILNTRMQPISTVFGKFPRLIRELGTKLKKDIALLTEGNEVELDKTVLEALSDPLTHIVRNTADHGIELPDIRKAKGKPVRGELRLKAFHESGQVIILVQDDGKGIDPEWTARKAYEKGLIRYDDLTHLGLQDKINLIFLPGFSTAEQVSSVSGRGVGMDVVRSNIEGIGGAVEISSAVDKGTTIKMTLPLTMAIVSCLIVSSSGERFAIPQINLEELVIVKPEEFQRQIRNIQDKAVLRIRGELLPLISLAGGLGLPSDDDTVRVGVTPTDMAGDQQFFDGNVKVREAIRILIVASAGHRIGIIVDAILGTEEIVVKPMPEYLNQVVVFSGATILGDGTVAMILDTNAFVQANRLTELEKRTAVFGAEEERRSLIEQQSILIFDNGTEEQFAVIIPLIQRVDTINVDQIQHVGDKEYIEYRGQQIRILRLADYLPVRKPSHEIDTLNIIIPKETRVPVAILIHKVLDTRTLKINLAEGSIHDKGIHGSTLIDGKITLLLDLYALLEMGEPESLHRIDIEADRLKDVKILLVEDTPMFLAVIREYLESAHLNVTAVINGRLALERLQQQPFDMVLTDIEMPEMDGWGLIQAIRSSDEWRRLPVIALTSLDDHDTIQAGLAAGFNDWIVKLDKHKILNCIAKLL